MEIFGGLIKLDDPDYLPVPVYNRPSLGLLTGTPVRIGVLKSPARIEAPPDIIVTPLHTHKLPCTTSVTVDLNERKGAILEVLRAIGTDLNIALTETITIDQRTKHRITLVLESPTVDRKELQAGIAKHKRLVGILKTRLKDLKGNIRDVSEFAADESTDFEIEDSGVVEDGAIRVRNIRE